MNGDGFLSDIVGARMPIDEKVGSRSRPVDLPAHEREYRYRQIRLSRGESEGSRMGFPSADGEARLASMVEGS